MFGLAESVAMRRFSALALAAALTAGLTASASARSHVSLKAPAKVEADPESVVTITGKVAGAPAGSQVALQEGGLLGRWRTLASAPIRAGRFRLSWRASIREGGERRFAVLEKGGCCSSQSA
jgi:hypothetical protein